MSFSRDGLKSREGDNRPWSLIGPVLSKVVTDKDCKFICQWCTERAKHGRSKPVLTMHIGFIERFHAISLQCSPFRKFGLVIFHTLVGLMPVVSLIS